MAVTTQGECTLTNKQTDTTGAEGITENFIDDIPFSWPVLSNTHRQHGPMEIKRLSETDRPEFKSFPYHHLAFISLTVGIFRLINELSQIQSIKMPQRKINEFNLSPCLS